jgi:hypothetical protein
MPKPALLLFSFLSIGNAMFAQNLTYSDTNYTFVVDLDTIWNESKDDYDFFSVKNIRVINNLTKMQIQLIEPEESNLMGNFDSELFFMEDVNFDGHSDIRILNQCPFHWQNRSYLYYAYDTLKKIFVKDTVLSELYIGSPEFDPLRKNIHSVWMDGAEYYGSSLYHYENGILTHVEELTISFSDGASYESTSQWVNGNWVEIKRIEREEIENKKDWIIYTLYERVKDDLAITKQKKYKGSIYDVGD